MSQLSISVGQFSHQGPKPRNEDFYGVLIPEEPVLSTKGTVVAVADGMTGSGAGREAAESCIKGIFTDYFATPESWTVKTSAEKILVALNSWLYSRGQGQGEAALATTLSLLVLKSNTAHLMHVGDSRISLLRDGEWRLLTRDHRVVLSGGRSYINRAMGIDPHLDVDYRTITVEVGDLFVLTTDGVHDFLEEEGQLRLVQEHGDDLDGAARACVETALAAGGLDNATCQLLRVDHLPSEQAEEFYEKLTELPFPPELAPGMVLDGYRILDEVHNSKRTQLYLAEDIETGERVALKTPSVNFDDDPEYIEHFILEDWAARRIDNPHVLKVHRRPRKRTWLYAVTEYVEGRSLRQWMNEQVQVDMEAVYAILEQVAAGLRAFHRLEMLHRDLKPENIMISDDGVVLLIDFGSVKIAGIDEVYTPLAQHHLLGTLDYAAPEYHMGQSGTPRSDLYSLGIVAYEMLAGRLPYAKPPTRTAACRERYISALHANPMIPLWMDGALEKAVACDPRVRYDALSEFLYDLSHPNARFMSRTPRPLIERNPVAVWRGISLLLLILNLLILYYFAG